MTRPSYPTALAVAALLAACGDHGDHAAPPAVRGVEPWRGSFEAVVATDLDPAADVVEVALEARVADVEIATGHHVSMWTYDGVLPGPTIEARAGDTVRVRLRNSLPEATTIHWHGLRVPNAMDGVHVVQAPVEPGAELTYEFVVPDAGTFWYHPHVRSDVQVERGLYGAIVVRGDDEPETTTDRVVVLDDVLVDDTWQLAPFDDSQAMVGRQGNVLLANGHASAAVEIASGGLHRFRFVNAANARFFRLALPGQTLVQIGTDGGLLEAPREVSEILLVPGERADVLLRAGGAEGDALEWKTLSYERGHMTGAEPDLPIFGTTLGAAVDAAPAMPASLATIPALPAATVVRELTLEESHDAGGHAGHGGGSPVFSINGASFPDGAPLTGVLGAVEEWSIVNATEMDHPFHLHGFRFQIVDSVPAWRDTINIPAMTTVRFRVRLEDHPGRWMFHCHILEHAERGMAGELIVE